MSNKENFDWQGKRPDQIEYSGKIIFFSLVIIISLGIVYGFYVLAKLMMSWL